jgi:hypothetical protein
MCHRLERQDVHLLGHDNFYFSSGFGTIYMWKIRQGLHDGRLESFVRLCTNFQHSSMCLQLQWQNADLIRISLYRFKFTLLCFSNYSFGISRNTVQGLTINSPIPLRQKDKLLL